MKKLLFLSIFIWSVSCGGSKKMNTQVITSSEDVVNISVEQKKAKPFEAEIMNREAPKENVASLCGDSDSYIPHKEDSVFFDTKIIRLNFHVMDRSEKDQNLKEGTEAETFIRKLVRSANKRLVKNHKMNLPANNKTAQLNPRYQYIVVGQNNGDDGIYYHYDDEHYYYLNHGKSKNHYKRDIINKYAVNSEEVLNVFLVPHHPDSVISKTYKESKAGIALGTDIKLGANWGAKRKDYWDYASLLNHEIGHVMSLRHSWQRNDGCDDTPEHKRNWKPGSNFPDGLTTNNVMDYNADQMSFTPCQLGRVHKVMSSRETKQRKLVVPNWCDFDASEEIIIDRKVQFNGARDLNKDLVIVDGGHLTINCRLSMARSSRIVVKPGGHLQLNNSFLHNDCGDEWLGIEVQQVDKKQGTVSYTGNVIIENVKAISKS